MACWQRIWGRSHTPLLEHSWTTRGHPSGRGVLYPPDSVPTCHPTLESALYVPLCAALSSRFGIGGLLPAERPEYVGSVNSFEFGGDWITELELGGMDHVDRGG